MEFVLKDLLNGIIGKLTDEGKAAEAPICVETLVSTELQDPNTRDDLATAVASTLSAFDLAGQAGPLHALAQQWIEGDGVRLVVGWNLETLLSYLDTQRPFVHVSRGRG